MSNVAEATIQSSIRECRSHIDRMSDGVRVLDILNRSHQLGVIEALDEWQRFRNLRNNLAHDYPETRDQTIATLNELFDTWNALSRMFY